MDCSYLGAQPQLYLMGLLSNGFVYVVDPEAMCSTEPFEAGFLSGPYDTFPFSHSLTMTPRSPDPVIAATPMQFGSADSGIGSEVKDNRASKMQSSSKEQNAGLSPAQNRRKAQNRAAQRTFRERKERHIRDLEAKLSALESSTHSLLLDNEQMKFALQRVRTENEILRASITQSPTSSKFNIAGKDDAASCRKDESREIFAAQTWDLIQSHPLVEQGLVDIADVYERLKGAARCDSNGLVFEGTFVWTTIESSRRSGGDGLI